MPKAVLILNPPGKLGEPVRALVPSLNEKKQIRGRPTLYLCEMNVCKAPVYKLDEVDDLLA